MNTRVATAVLSAVVLAAACSRREEAADPTGLKPGMTQVQVIEILGPPTQIKPAGKNKEIYIYRGHRELIHVFLVKGKIKNIEHVRRRPPTVSR